MVITKTDSFKCLSETSRVNQSTSALIKPQNEEIQLSCSHSDTNFDMILWYKQSAGKHDMVLLGYVRFTSPVVEDQFTEKLVVSGDGSKQSSLKIKKSQPEDSAVYFCAASRAQCSTKPTTSTKTFSDTQTASRPHCERLISDSCCSRKQQHTKLAHQGAAFQHRSI